MTGGRADINTITEVWHRVVGTQPDPPTWLVLACGLLALAAVVPDRAWRVARNVATITHEGGHALAALVTGRRLGGIRLHADTSGVTVSAGRPTGPGMVLTSAAGYIASPLLGLGGAWLLAAGHVTALLWISLVLLGGMLVLIRNPFGAATVLAAGAAVFLISWLTPASVQAAFAYLLTWFLLLGGLRPVVELQHERRRRRAPNSDADQLARLTRVPGLVWVALFTLTALAAILAGGRWLLHLG
ncbi:MAG TPA: M50 family metallopeptidase [Actinomycetota bacterium]